MHFLTLTAVQVSDMEEDLEQNKIIEEQMNKLKEAIEQEGRETSADSIFLQRLTQLSTTLLSGVRRPDGGTEAGIRRYHRLHQAPTGQNRACEIWFLSKSI